MAVVRAQRQLVALAAWRAPRLIASTARPVRRAAATVITIATLASTHEAARPAPVGAQEAEQAVEGAS